MRVRMRASITSNSLRRSSADTRAAANASKSVGARCSAPQTSSTASPTASSVPCANVSFARLNAVAAKRTKSRTVISSPGRGRRAVIGAGALVDDFAVLVRFGMLVADHHQAIGARLAAPRLARPPQHLAHACALLVAWEAFETLGHWVEAQHRVGGEVGDPDLVLVVDIDRVAAELADWQLPQAPPLGGGVVIADRAGMPEAHPEAPLRIRPHAARPGARARRV